MLAFGYLGAEVDLNGQLKCLIRFWQGHQQEKEDHNACRITAGQGEGISKAKSAFTIFLPPIPWSLGCHVTRIDRFR